MKLKFPHSHLGKEKDGKKYLHPQKIWLKHINIMTINIYFEG